MQSEGRLNNHAANSERIGELKPDKLNNLLSRSNDGNCLKLNSQASF